MARKDLIVLVADKNMESTIAGLLSRPQRLGIRPITVDIRAHSEHDAGCRSEAPQFLKLFEPSHSHALVMFDREGCGQDHLTREALESDMENRLQVIWSDRAAAVVFDPELEIWVWSDSPHVARVLGWEDRAAEMRAHLTSEGFFSGEETKPQRPKEAVEEALRVTRLPRSSARYRDLAEQVSFRRCGDEAFLKFKSTLQIWFPPTQ